MCRTQPLAGAGSLGHAGVMAQAPGVNALQAEHGVQISQMAMAQQADEQRLDQTRAKALAVLHQLRQQCLNLGTAQQGMADTTEQVRQAALQRFQQIAAVDHRTTEGNHA
uniref:SWIRM-assoc_1 domain-containing protein n=1 Tax=Steinernema glaseri TaxID=37863 RepID=A0A1I8AL30_9BILA